MVKWSGEFAKVGDVVVCENGHRIATVIRPLERYTILSPKDFRWYIEEPQGGSVITGCPECGAVYIRDKPEGGFQINIEGEWRP